MISWKMKNDTKSEKKGNVIKLSPSSAASIALRASTWRCAARSARSLLESGAEVSPGGGPGGGFGGGFGFKPDDLRPPCFDDFDPLGGIPGGGATTTRFDARRLDAAAFSFASTAASATARAAFSAPAFARTFATSR